MFPISIQLKNLAIVCVLAASCIPQWLHAQNVGIGTPTPAPSAQLDVASTTKGVLIPRVTTTQMNAIASPANGLLVYNTTASAFAYRTTSGWVFLTGNTNAGAGWSTLGNAGTNPATNFIGTSDDADLVFKRNNIRAGIVNSALANTSLGVSSLSQITTGSGNIAFGQFALGSDTSGTNNSALGGQALGYNTSGSSNTAIGHSAMLLNQTGSENIAIGDGTLGYNDAGNNGIAIGYRALFQTDNTTTPFTNTNIAIGSWALAGSPTPANNTGLANNGIGYFTLRNNTTGSRNIALGTETLLNNTTGSGNIAIGFRTLYSNTDKSGLIAIGDSALYNNGVGAADFQAIRNTAVGSKALYSNSTGSFNTANGSGTLFNNTTGVSNTAIGVSSLFSNISGDKNTATGVDALARNTTGNNNTANGENALASNTTGFSNVAVGIQALRNNTTRSNLVAIGDSALYNNGVGATQTFHAAENTATGSKALYSNTTGYYNTANGAFALNKNTTGHSNTANGNNALYHNTGGTNNTAIGARALFDNTMGIYNTATGMFALTNNTTGNSNTVNGADALFTNTEGSNNTANGREAGFNNQIGSGNVFIGNRAGFSETGSNKLYINNDNGNADNSLLYGEFDTDKLRIHNKLGIGRLPAAFPLEIKALGGSNELLKFFTTAGTERWHINLLNTGSLNFVETNVADNRLVLGTGGEVGVGKVPLTSQDDSRLHVKQKGAQNGIGIEASGSANHWDFYVNTGASSDLILYYNGVPKGTFGNAGGVYTPSDKRLKKDIATYEPILNKLQQLEAFHYHYLDNKSTDPLSTGFMAQDVQKIFPDAVNETEMKNGEKMLGINYQYFTVMAIKGLQEQQKEIADMKLQLKLMMEEIEKLKKK